MGLWGLGIRSGAGNHSSAELVCDSASVASDDPVTVTVESSRGPGGGPQPRGPYSK
jgi:hypothetical protein